jgi:hypothetical protein
MDKSKRLVIRRKYIYFVYAINIYKIVVVAAQIAGTILNQVYLIALKTAKDLIRLLKNNMAWVNF